MDSLSDVSTVCSLFGSAACPGSSRGGCEALPIRVLRSHLAVFDEAGQARMCHGSGLAA